MTKNEQKRVGLIKRDLDTRIKWSKQDYSDFYYRDITLLLSIVDKLTSQQPVEADAIFLCKFNGQKDCPNNEPVCGRTEPCTA